MNDLKMYNELFEATVRYFVLHVAYQLLNDETYTKESAAQELTDWLEKMGLD
ncbi:hypothetical protein [Bacillus sp. FJAT-45350]|uniref:hypothetical protein n=1 Tax=Bacillus sp. FJAT-45350 TaxID=2011014 RepID=UPI0015CC4946|nr:hypothetical protein [Bacillus sp. FJAT-45350]